MRAEEIVENMGMDNEDLISKNDSESKLLDRNMNSQLAYTKQKLLDAELMIEQLNRVKMDTDETLNRCWKI